MKEEKRLISSEALFSAIGELLAEDRQAVFVVTGMSMWPFLCHGRDQVVVERCDQTRLKRGDVVLFQTVLGNYILHRITRLDSEFFESTGDGNCFRDGRFPRTCIKARVRSFIRKGKTIPCDSPVWRAVFALWGALFPVRRFLLRALRMGSRLKTSMIKAFKHG